MKWVKLLLCIIGCELAGVIGSVFTIPAIPEWYAQLNKPFFSPPNWLFGPVWTILFVLMGLSFYFFLEAKTKQGHGKKSKDSWKEAIKSLGAKVFYLQLGLNVLWSEIFFGFKLPGLAFVEIIALWLSILLTIAFFRESSKKAAWLLVPYIVWVSIASALNLAIAMLN